MEQTKLFWSYRIFRTNDGWRWQVMRDGELVENGIAADMAEARVRVMLRAGGETHQRCPSKGAPPKFKRRQ